MTHKNFTLNYPLEINRVVEMVRDLPESELPELWWFLKKEKQKIRDAEVIVRHFAGDRLPAEDVILFDEELIKAN